MSDNLNDYFEVDPYDTTVYTPSFVPSLIQEAMPPEPVPSSSTNVTEHQV